MPMIRFLTLIPGVATCAGCATSAPSACDSSPVPAALAVPNLSDFPDRGAMTLSVLVDTQGRTGDTRVLSSSGLPSVDEMMRFAVRATRFVHGGDNCKPVERWMTITVPAEDAGKGIQFTNKDELQRMIEREYPPLLRDSGRGGAVIVLVHIDEQGAVRRAAVSRSSGDQALDRGALRIAQAARFVPAVYEGKAVSAWATMPIPFETR